MLVRQMPGKLLKDLHVLRIVAGNVRLQNLEDASLAPTTLGVSPAKAHHCADTRLGEDGRIEFDSVGFDLRPQVPQDDGANLGNADVGDPVLEGPERTPHPGIQVPVARQYLANL